MVVVTGRIAYLRVNKKTTIPKNTKPPDKASNINGLLKPAKGLAPYMIAPQSRSVKQQPRPGRAA
ncbi:hypothetical protein HJG40_07715 [Acidithiobacillus sp. ATCC 19703]|uniref:Uncharacterized protein n=2 Tax=Acidithiobacillus concretivorus TaxID=3063952 RepID=A0ABS5ZPY3_9PROT|nr:hypothetical protein [Acidithiobacillus concretivorus]